MEFFAVIEEKWNLLCDKTRPFRMATSDALKKTGRFFRIIWQYIYRLRTVFLSVPVIVAAVLLALQNLDRLPERVGIWLLSNGEFWLVVPKGLAVAGPIAVTAFCILMLLCSKKVLYPWMISIFSLVLPALIYYTNVFPM